MQEVVSLSYPDGFKSQDWVLNMQVSRFNWDRFDKVDVFELKEGDQIIVDGSLVEVTGTAYRKDGNIHLPATPVNQPIILCDFSDSALTRAIDYVGSSQHSFGDGTAIIAELDGTSDLVYSPRLPKAELEAFCQKHMVRYVDFNREHAAAIDDCQKIRMEPWW